MSQSIFKRYVMPALLISGLLLASSSVAWAGPIASNIGEPAYSSHSDLSFRADATCLDGEGGSPVARVINALLRMRKALIHGRVTTIEADGFRLSTRIGEVFVQVTGDTHYRFPGTDQPGLNALSLGDRVLVAGAREGEGSLRARLVVKMPHRPRNARVVGQITAIEDTTLTLTRRSGDEIDLHTDENTRFLVPGLSEGNLFDLEIGEAVAVQIVALQGEEMPYAALVAVLRDLEGNWTVLRGRLLQVKHNTLFLQLRSGDRVELSTDENTQFFIRGLGEASLADLRVCDIIAAQFVKQEDSSLYASVVGVTGAHPRPRLGAVIGRIATIEGDRITLNTRRGEVIVLTDIRTRFYRPGAEDPALADLEVGQIIGAFGHWEKDGHLHARLVGTRS